MKRRVINESKVAKNKEKQGILANVSNPTVKKLLENVDMQSLPKFPARTKQQLGISLQDSPSFTVAGGKVNLYG